MPESDQPTEAQASQAGQPAQIKSIEDVLRTIIGRLVIVSTLDSLQALPLGYQVKPSCYNAKVLKVFTDMVVLAAEGSRKKSDEKPATLKQYVPLSTVRRVCVGKGEIHLHL